MKNRLVEDSKRKTYIPIIIFAISMIINLIPILFLNYAAVSDEIGTIANGAFLAGVDWSEGLLLTVASYYKYGQALLYTPLYLIFDNPIIIYKCALVINAVLISLIPVIVYSICTKYLNISTKASAHIALLIGFLPSSTTWSKLVWAESLMYLMVWVVLYLFFVCSQCKERKKLFIYSFLLGVAAVIPYMSHARGIVVVIATFMVLIFIWFISKKRIVSISMYALGTIMALVFDKILSDYLMKTLWGNRTTNNSILSTIEGFRRYDIISIKGINTVIGAIISWLYTAICGSYGLVMIGAFIATVAIFFTIKNRKSKICNNQDIINIYALLIFIGSFVMGLFFFTSETYEIINLGDKNRFDRLIYGRYIAVGFGPLILAFFSELYVNKAEIIKKNFERIVVVTAGVLIVFIIGFSSLAEGTSVATMQLSLMPLFLKSTINIVETFDNLYRNIVICGVGVLIVCMFIVRCIKKKKYLFMMEIISVLFLLTYSWNMSTSYIPINREYYNQIKTTTNTLNKLEGIYKEYPYLAVGISRGVYSYQFAFDKYTILGSKMALEEEYDNLFIVYSSNETEYSCFETEYYRFEEDTNVLIKGSELNNKINEMGMDTILVNSINIQKQLNLYNEENVKQRDSDVLQPCYTLFSSSSLTVTSNEFELKITAQNVETDDLDIVVEGMDGVINVDSIDVKDNVYIAKFKVKRTKDKLLFTISNTGKEDLNIEDISVDISQTAKVNEIE